MVLEILTLAITLPFVYFGLVITALFKRGTLALFKQEITELFKQVIIMLLNQLATFTLFEPTEAHQPKEVFLLV